MCNTLIFSIVLIFNNKKMMIVIHYIDFNTNKSHQYFEKTCTEDVLTLFLNTDSNTLCQCFYFNKNTKLKVFEIYQLSQR